MTVEGKDWLRIIPTAGAIGLVVYLAVTKLRSGVCGGSKGQVNQSVQKDQAKVVHCIDVEELGESTAFCRCWRSKEFPYCDGSHVAHNKCTGDNVGPLCVSKKTE